MPNDTLPGTIVTFYSYKGGTGRSMALVNAACILAQHQEHQRGVLVIDWDLEAPGLHHFFCHRVTRFLANRNIHTFDDYPGLIDFFIELNSRIGSNATDDRDAETAMRDISLDRYLIHTDIPYLDFLKAGRFDVQYDSNVSTFNWEVLYRRVPCVFRLLSVLLASRYEYVLIDSRTGLNDSSGICTMLMPEKLVAVFTPSHQSLSGLIDIITKATNYRKQSNDLRPLVVFPLDSRIEMAEPTLREQWRFGSPARGLIGYQQQFEAFFRNAYELRQCDLTTYFDEVQIQHVPRYAYGEEIAVLIERSGDRLSLSKSYENFVKWLVKPTPYEEPDEGPAAPQELIVCPTGSGHYSTIAEAVNAAQPRACIRIRNGTYNERIVMDKPLEIIGDSWDVIVEATNTEALSFGAEHGKVANMRLRSKGGSRAVTITKGHLVLERCDIVSERSNCIVINGGSPHLLNNSIHNSEGGCGVYVHGAGAARLVENNIYENAHAGVVIEGNVNPSLYNNKINGNTRQGLYIHQRGGGIIEKNEIFGNGFANVEIRTEATPTLRYNRISGGKAEGLLISYNGNGTLEHNDVSHNFLAGVSIIEGGDPLMRDNSIHHGDAEGVYVGYGGRGTLGNNSIFENTRAGVRIERGGNPKLCGNHIIRNGHEGIRVENGGAGIIDDNDLSGNGGGALTVSEDSVPMVGSNKS